MVTAQIRLLLGLILSPNYFEAEDPIANNFRTFGILYLIVMNHQIILKIYQKYINSFNLVMCLVLTICVIEKSYGIKNFNEKRREIILNSCTILLITMVFFLLNNHMLVINKKLILIGNRSMSDMNARDYLQR